MATTIINQSGAFAIADADIGAGDDSVTYRCTGSFAITLPDTGATVTAKKVFIIQSMDGLQTFTYGTATVNIPEERLLTPYGANAFIAITCSSTYVYDITGDMTYIVSSVEKGLIGTNRVGISDLVLINTTMPWDDTIPQSNEGQEIITITYTPKYADSILRVECSMWGNYEQDIVGTALFRDSNVDADAVTMNYGSILYTSAVISYDYPSNSTAPTTFKVRMGIGSGVAYLNGASNGVRAYGGVANSYLQVTEIRVG